MKESCPITYTHTHTHTDSHTYTHTHIYIYIYKYFVICLNHCTNYFILLYSEVKKIHIRGSLNKFQTFFVWALLLTVHTWNSSPLWSNLLRSQCTCCTVPKASGTPHGSPLVWACQWPSSQALSSPQLSHNNSLWAEGIAKSHREQSLDNREVEELFWCLS